MKSPCVNLCRLRLQNEKYICIGCNRTNEQIFKWSKYSDDERDSIISELEKMNENTET